MEKILFILINEQMKAGHQVDLVVYDYEQAWVNYFREHGINVISDYRKNKGYDLRLLKWLNEIVPNYDVVHTHDLNPIMYVAPLKIITHALGKNFPRLIHTAHGMDHIHKRPITLLYEKLCSTVSDTTVGVSPAVADVYKRKLLVSDTKVINIDNGTMINSMPFSKTRMRKDLRVKLNIKNEWPIWVYVARIVPLKNHHYIIEAVRNIPNINVIFAGPSGNIEYSTQLKQDCPDHVHFIGSCDYVSELLSGADYYISSSTHEGIPVSVLEAGAMKLPCLLSDIPGHRLLGKSAEYFPLNDVSILQTKILSFSNDPDRVQALGESLHNIVKERYSSESMYRSYMKTYRAAYAE